MLIEIHMIQNHSPSNLNRDDLGAPKSCVFGGVTRARISSQCIKRSIRNPGNPHDPHNRGPGVFYESLSERLGRRTKFFPHLVGEQLKSSGIPKDEHEKIVTACTKIAAKEQTESAPTAEEPELDDRPRLPQLVFLHAAEAERFVEKLEEMRESDEWKGHYEKWIKGKLKGKPLADFLRELARAYKRRSVDIALFGRMTTSDAFQDVEAAMQVAHAISTHETVTEVDYFTAVDDLGEEGGGAGHVAEAMYNSACFYKYFSLDWDQLIRNLNGPEPDEAKNPTDHEKWRREVRDEIPKLAAAAVGHFIRAAALTTPSGKQNSFASHNCPSGILVEIKKSKIPTSYANAFAEPVVRIGEPDDDAPDEKSLIGRSVAFLADHVHAMRDANGIDSELFWFSPQLWKFPFQYWERSDNGRKKVPKPVTKRQFKALESNGSTKGLIEAVVSALGFNWADVKDVGIGPDEEPDS